ncbi:MAG: hypothetical protein IT337_15435 [Thermomicrobiales bacterium]|nr:hypothetical protein [Thermomicrobiales bacterium]
MSAISANEVRVGDVATALGLSRGLVRDLTTHLGMPPRKSRADARVNVLTADQVAALRVWLRTAAYRLNGDTDPGNPGRLIEAALYAADTAVGAGGSLSERVYEPAMRRLVDAATAYRQRGGRS